MTVSIMVLITVEHIRQQAKSSFASSVSGVDVIVGARTGSLNLLLYSVFRVGAPTSNMSWQSYQQINNNSAVKWSIPLSLGDSHRGYRVLGTTNDYFEYFSYGKKQRLSFASGRDFETVLDVVLGAGVAKKLGYNLGQTITLSHGIGTTSFSNHDHLPFRISGILKPTGTPIDQTVHVDLQGLEAVHVSPKKALKLINQAEPIKPESLTAIMVGLESRVMAFNFQRGINNNIQEPLTAILPGVTLAELWQNMGIVESTLRVISLLVLVSSLLGLSAMMLTSIKERMQEIRLMRTMGASPLFIYCFIEFEALIIAATSCILAILISIIGLTLTQPLLLNLYGLNIELNIFTEQVFIAIFAIFALTFIAAIPPAVAAFKQAKR